MQVSSKTQVDLFVRSGIFVPLSTPGHSEVVVTASLANNGTSYKCFVEEAGSIAVLNRSERVQLLVYGMSVVYVAVTGGKRVGGVI